MSMSLEQRVNFYLSPSLSESRGTYVQTLPTRNHENIYIGNYVNAEIPEGVSLNYITPLLEKLKEYKIDENLLVMVGDVIDNNTSFAVVKSRLVGGEVNKYTILKCMNRARHWGEWVYTPDEVKFSEKKNLVYWRGTTTGFPPDHFSHRGGDRFTLVTTYFDETSFCDIGFSYICQDQDKYSDYIKGMVDVSEMRNYRYIISAEGNDKDSGLNWKLNSNSVIMMPKPNISTWLMEETLVPFRDYIQLRDDFSDLQEKYEWCEHNQSACEEIIHNAKIFMSKFNNEEHESYIEKRVIEKHLDRVVYV